MYTIVVSQQLFLISHKKLYQTSMFDPTFLRIMWERKISYGAHLYFLENFKKMIT